MRRERWIITVTFIAAWPIFSVLVLFLGLTSMRRLGNALERTGQNLQGYGW